MDTLKLKVTKQLVKWGNNPKEVEDMVSKHFESGASIFSSVKSIAEYIRTVY